ncbi:MAG: hypothetical protein IT168_16185 [Bryobacterales bacterium]|nr:hypothetical protein [Bryobacterales bacterium]
MKSWRPVTVCVAVIVLLLLLIPATAVFAQDWWYRGAGLPYWVHSELQQYPPDVSSGMQQSYVTSYMVHRRELTLSHHYPGHPGRSAIRTSLDILGFVLFKYIVEPIRGLARMSTEAATLPVGDCFGPGVESRLGETILGYDTRVREWSYGHERMTVWLAPQLGCFPLRMRSMEKVGGNWVPRFERSGLRVEQ